MPSSRPSLLLSLHHILLSPPHTIPRTLTLILLFLPQLRFFQIIVFRLTRFIVIIFLYIHLTTTYFHACSPIPDVVLVPPLPLHFSFPLSFSLAICLPMIAHLPSSTTFSLSMISHLPHPFTRLS